VTVLPHTSLVDRVVDGRYRVQSHLADGGMASVYVAVDERLERDVALKIMRPDLARDESFVSRFRREARSAARLSHPNVVAVYDQGSDEGYVFLAMELVPGTTLRHVLSTEGPLTPRAALDVIESVLRALDAAHRAGIIHRDVKPENVLIGEDGMVKVADFGLARAVTTATRTSHTDVLLGTAAYLSPEQVERGIADARTDVYAAGLLLFEMLTGVKAFPGESPIHVAYQHVHGVVARPSEHVPSVPAELDGLVALATARDPDRRPSDAGAMLAEVRRSRDALDLDELDRRPEPGTLAAAGTNSPTTALPSTRTRSMSVPPRDGRGRPEPEAPPRRRARWPWAVLLVLVLALAGGGAWWFLAGPGSRTPVPRVAGMPQAEAVASLDQQHLQADVHPVFSERVRKGVVVATDPRPGQEVRRASSVELDVSKGPERHAVPALAGHTRHEAQRLLERSHLTLGKVTGAYDEHVAAGKVLSSDPAKGASLKRGTAVSLVVSKGRQPVAVPDLTGKAKDDAVTALEQAGLRADAGHEEFSDTVAKGAVMGQDPPGGTLHRGDTVHLTISKGPQLFKVPDVMWKKVDEAQRILQQAGFSVKIDSFLGGVLHTVRLQSPEPGSMQPRGTEVTLTVI
jgi:eukaryotic-like serine/threonine-protein kinase